MTTYNNKTVAEVVLAPSAVQPEGATGDNRFIMISFTDYSTPVTTTISALKAQVTQFTNQAANMTSNAAKATLNATNTSAVVALTTGL